MGLLTLENVSFSYGKTKVLEDVTYSFDTGKMYAIVGQSGAGKTTLLSLLSGLAKPNSGTITYDGQDIRRMNTYDYRSHCVGVIFQSYNLLTKYTAAENIRLSMDIAGVRGGNVRVHELLRSMGIEKDEADRRVLHLSGGQQQRVAIARALAYDPQIILADEPTGNLDGETQDEILAIFRALAQAGKCVIIVTHSPAVAEACDEVYTLQRLGKRK